MITLVLSHNFLSKILNKEYYSLQNSSEKRLVELESKCKEQVDKLAVYEKLEQELDDVIMQAAESKEYEDIKVAVLMSINYLIKNSKKWFKWSFIYAKVDIYIFQSCDWQT